MKCIFCSLALCLLGVPAQAYDLPKMSQLLENATWGWSDQRQVCHEKLREFRFNSDLTEMLNIQSKNIDTKKKTTSTYRVLSHTPNSITMQIEGEKRMTKADEPVIWELRFNGPDEFCWHRLDWKVAACTAFLVRCSGPDLIS